MNFKLTQEYINLGFNIFNLGSNSFALKHGDRTIFVFGSDLDLRDNFLNLLCESYLSLTSATVGTGANL